MNSMKEAWDQLKSLIDSTTLYYFVIPIAVSLGIGGIYLAIMFYRFVIER